MRRIVSVYLPTWPIDRIRRRMLNRSPSAGRDEPYILLIERKSNTQTVAACCPKSMACGVVIGMTLAHARALLPQESDQVFVAPHEPSRDRVALRALAMWANRFSPIVAPDDLATASLRPDGLLLDVSGCERLYGGERRLLNLIGNTLERMGFHARIACAGTIGCAWAVARFGCDDRTVIAPGCEREALEPLPIECLRLDADTIHGLHEVNITRVGELLSVPRLELLSRFDPMILRRIDQALGEINEAIDPIRQRDPFIAERLFDGPTCDTEAISITVRELTEEVARSLGQRESGVMRLRLTMERSDMSLLEIDLRLSRPSRDAPHLWSLLRPKVESAHLGYGVEGLTLRIIDAQRMRHEQVDTGFGSNEFDSARLDRAKGILIDTLTHRLGPRRTLRLGAVESHRPERVAQHSAAIDSVDRASARYELVDEDRPSILFAHPQPIEVMALTPDGPPLHLCWRGASHDLIGAHGPQRIAGEWWSALTRPRADRMVRDYFKVQDRTGRWLWIFRSVSNGCGNWFIHGIWA